MAFKLNDITFIKGEGGSGRTAVGTDYISGLLFFNDTRPAGFADNIKNTSNVLIGGVHQVFSADDAKNIGINDLLADETQATATIQITGSGAAGDIISVYVQEWEGGSGKGYCLLGSYKVKSGDGVNDIASGLRANIQTLSSGISGHNYSSSVVTDTITITARKGTGIYLNAAGKLTNIIIGTVASTITDFSGGVASRLATYYYHIERYFKMKPDGRLYVGIFDEAEASSFNVIRDMMVKSDGDIVQMGIYDEINSFDVSTAAIIQSVIDEMETHHILLSSVVYSVDIISVGLDTMVDSANDLSTLSARKVSMIIDNDFNGKGWDLFNGSGRTISSLGACIGAISEAAISEDIGNIIPRFNTDDGLEFDKLAFGDGTDYKAVPQAKLDALNNAKYLFLSKMPYTFGSYYNDDWTACPFTSDYSEIRDNRTIDRVIKDLFSAMTPVLKSRLKLKTDGTMANSTIAYIIQLAGEVIKPLIASDDLAGDAQNFIAEQWILVNPNQKPNVTGKLVVSVKLVPNGIAHSIEIPIGFTSTL